MGHDHNGHEHGGHDGHEPGQLAPHLDPALPDSELRPADLDRRLFLRRVGLFGATAATTSVVGLGPLAGAAAADKGRPGEDRGHRPLRWLAGDHHIHTQYSPDAQYKVVQQVGNAARYGLDWCVITDHGGVAHQKFSVDLTYPDVVAARRAYGRLLVFQGLEWNIPSAEHGTVFLAPGPNEVDLLKTFEGLYDGVVKGATASSPANEGLAVSGIRWLGEQVAARRTASALFLANHPSRKGLDSPHEFRAWRAANPDVAVGMEGAPGHQAAGIAAPAGPGSGRGYYDSNPSADSFPGYPLESYRTWGGFDWITSSVGGLWDSLLAEGRGWWITSNSDSHKIYRDTLVNPTGNDRAYYDAHGKYPDPVDSGVPHPEYGDFAPGFYSRTLVGAVDNSYTAVMEGIRRGRVWVCHGDLIRSLDVSVVGHGRGKRRDDERRAGLGERLVVRRGDDVELRIEIGLADNPNYHGDLPTLARVDIIAGGVTGPVADPDTFTAPTARVVRSFDVGRSRGRVVLHHRFKDVEGSFYMRIRGTDGHFGAPGAINPAADPEGPRMDPVGDADPWADLWFYANPVFVDVDHR